MKLISVNIETNRHTKTVLDFLKKENADVVCVQELLEEEIYFYEEELNLKGVFQAFSYIKHPIYVDLDSKKQGVGIFTKNIIDSGSIFYFGKEENLKKSFDDYMSNISFQKNYALVWVDIKNSAGLVFRFITTHLPVTKEGESSPFQLEVLDGLLTSISHLGEFVLCGDMNAPRGNETFRRINEKYKDNIPLEYKTSIDQNLHRVKGIQFMVDGLFTTSKYKT